MEAILPQIDTEALQKKANEYAQKGAEETLKEFYSGYNSPYRKAILDSLTNKAIGHSIEIPDIIGYLNESLSKEIDVIANEAVSKTFVPMVKKFLTRADAEIKLSDILKEFIEYTKFEYSDDLDADDYSVSIEKDDGSFIYLEIKNTEQSYKVPFYKTSKNNESSKVYECYTLPYKDGSKIGGSSYRGQQTMKLSMDSVTLELPFTTDVLSDEFTSYIAKLIIAKTQITFDVDDFNEDMFPERHCNC